MRLTINRNLARTLSRSDRSTVRFSRRLAVSSEAIFFSDLRSDDLLTEQLNVCRVTECAVLFLARLLGQYAQLFH